MKPIKPPYDPIFVEIRDKYKSVESAAHLDTVSECIAWFNDHDINFAEVKQVDFGFTFTREVNQ